MTPEQEIKLLKELLYCTKRSCNNCGKVNCENFQRQRKSVSCELYVSYQDRIKQLEKQIEKMKKDLTEVKNNYDKSEDKTPISAFKAEYRLFCDIENLLDKWE